LSLRVFESSQYSLPITNPSPHLGEQIEGVVGLPGEQFHFGLIDVHPILHPFPSFDPSSQTSETTTNESPQIKLHKSGVVNEPPEQVHPSIKSEQSIKQPILSF